MLQIIRCLPKRYFQLDLPILLVNWKSSQYCEIALLFSFLENIRHMGKETNSFTLIDVSGPLAQSADSTRWLSTQISPKKLRGGSFRVVTSRFGSN